MDRHEQIRQRLKQMASEVGPDFSMLAQVRSVNEQELTCDLYDDDSGLDFYDVRLRPVLDGSEFVTVIPKVDSWVLAVRIEDSEDWLTIAYGEVEKVIVKVGNTVMEQTAEGFLVKNGNDTLKQVVQLIIEAVQKIVVIQGTNPDYVKLTQALTKAQNILR